MVVRLGLSFCACLLLCCSALGQVKYRLHKVWATEPNLEVVESVCFNYDSQDGELFASCINGKPAEKNGKGYIAKFNKDGTITKREWATGLNAPKGMAIVKNILYVSDIDHIVLIDIETGNIIKKIKVPGAKFLNDLTSDLNDGTIYFTDSETKKIWTLEGEKPVQFFTYSKFKALNGILSLGPFLVVADMASGIIYKLEVNRRKIETIADGIKGADGIVQVGKTDFLISAWGGEVWWVSESGEKKKLLDTVSAKLNAADIEYLPKEKLLLVPTFFGNSVMSYELEKN